MIDGKSWQDRARTAQTEGKDDSKKHRIQKAAMLSFLDNGFDNANLENIAIAAGVSKATIYQYYVDKTDLFKHVVYNAVHDMALPLGRVLAKDLPIEQVLADFARRYIGRQLWVVVESRPFYEVARLLLGSSLKHPDLAAACFEVFHHNIRRPLAEYFSARMEREPLREEPVLLADHFIQLLFFTNSTVLNPASPGTLEKLQEAAVRASELFVHGCLVKRVG